MQPPPYNTNDKTGNVPRNWALPDWGNNFALSLNPFVVPMNHLPTIRPPPEQTTRTKMIIPRPEKPLPYILPASESQFFTR